MFEGNTSNLPVRQFVRDLDAVDTAGRRVNSTFGGIGSAATVALGGAAVAAATALTGALLNAADASAVMEKKVLEIGTLMGGLTKGEMREMSNELGRLSIMTGQAIEPLAKARYDIVSAGFFKASESALVLDQSARLAVGGVTSVSTAADLLTTVINAYQLKASDARDVSDDLFTIVKYGKATMDDLGGSLGQLIAIAGPAGVSLDEVGAAVAALTSQGQSTPIAVTSISAAISELMRPSAELQKTMAAAGIATDNLIESGHGLTGAMKLLEEASDRTGTPLAKMIQREEALRALMPLLSTASQVYADDLNQMASDAGATDEAFKQMSGSSAMLKDQASAAFEAAKRSVGDAVIESEIYKGVLEGIKGLFEGIAGVSGDARDAAVDDAKDVEDAWRDVGSAVRDAFGQAKKFWDWTGEADKSIADWESKNNGYQRVVARVEAQQKTNAARNTPANANEFGFYESMKATNNSLKKLAAATGENTEETKKNSGGHRQHTSTLAGATRRTAELSAGARMTAEALSKAEEWYGRETESVKGLYDAQTEYEQKVYNLALLLNAGQIDQREFNTRANEAATALESLRISTNQLIDTQIEQMVQNNPEIWGKSAKQIEDAAKKWGSIGDGLSQAGYTLGGRIGGGVSTIGYGVGQLGVDTSQMTSAQKFASQVGAYSSIASGVGQMIGGSTGSAISNIAGMAAAGATIGGPIGAVVGGVIGLASSLFGGSSKAKEERANRDQMRQQIYSNSVDSALSGGTESLKLMRAAGWNYDALKNLADPYPGSLGAGSRLFEDRGETRLKQLQEVLNVLDAAGQTIESFAKPSIRRDLEKAKAQLEYTIAKVGSYADAASKATEAYWATVIDTVTGVNADSLVSSISNAVESADLVSPGQAFVDELTSGISSAIKSAAISQVVESLFVPTLQPILQSITSVLISGGSMSSASMASLLSQARSAAEGLAPVVNTLAQAFSDAGLMVEDTATRLANAISDARSVLDSSLSKLSDSIQAEKDRLQDLYDAQVAPLNDIKSLLDSAKSSVESVSSLETRMGAQAQLSLMLSSARSGAFPSSESLSPVLSELGKSSSQYYATASDYRRDYYQTANMIAELSSLTDDQLTTAEKQLQAQYDSLDAIYATSKAQYDALLGIDSSVLSVADAVSGFDASLSALASAMAGVVNTSTTTTGSTSSITDQAVIINTPSSDSASLAAAASLKAEASAAASEALRLQQVADKLRIKYAGDSGTWPQQWIADAQLAANIAANKASVLAAQVAGYADGGDHAGGWRVVGERGWELEQTGPSRIYSHEDSKAMLDNRQVVAEMKGLRKEAQAAQYAMVKALARMQQLMEKWERDGLPKETTV